MGPTKEPCGEWEWGQTGVQVVNVHVPANIWEQEGGGVVSLHVSNQWHNGILKHHHQNKPSPKLSLWGKGSRRRWGSSTTCGQEGRINVQPTDKKCPPCPNQPTEEATMLMKAKCLPAHHLVCPKVQPEENCPGSKCPTWGRVRCLSRQCPNGGGRRCVKC